MKKNFILDTNVILSSGTGGGSKVLDGFIGGKDANDITIPGTVLQELDKHKTDGGIVGYNARDFIRTMDDLRARCENSDDEEDVASENLISGIKLKRGKIIVEPDGIKCEYLPAGFDLSVPDNRIISTCIHLAKRYPRRHYVFVSNDVSCRINADVCFRAANVHIGIESYKNDQVITDKDDDSYLGYETWNNADPALVNKLYEDGTITTDLTKNLVENEFVILKGQNSAIAIYENGALKLVKEPKVFGLKKLYNAQQIMAMYALLAPPEEIPLVVLTGAAGSGKTFLPVAAGIDRIYGQMTPMYDRMIISRSNQLSKGEELGFLPGDIDDKMTPLILPVRDSIESILRTKNNGNKESSKEIANQVDDIFESCIDVMPMLYVRGRSLTNRFILLDEAQNVTEQQAYDVLTRCSTGSKICMVGDIGQVDNTLLDSKSNGLYAVWQKMRGKGVCMVHFGEHEVIRSQLVKYAMERMKC